MNKIQHAIQYMEKFESDMNTRNKLAYYNSLGEIEASNTKERFLKEKYNNENISYITPKSSRKNP